MSTAALEAAGVLWQYKCEACGHVFQARPRQASEVQHPAATPSVCGASGQSQQIPTGAVVATGAREAEEGPLCPKCGGATIKAAAKPEPGPETVEPEPEVVEAVTPDSARKSAGGD